MTERYEALSWEEAAALDDYTGVTVRIGDRRRAVTQLVDTLVTFERDETPVRWRVLEGFGAVIERRVPEHPNGVVRQEVGSAVRLGDGRYGMRVDDGDLGWMLTSGDSQPHIYWWEYPDVVQALADEHGFTPLEDASAAREEGRREGIRDAYRELDAGSARRSMTFLRQAFPEAFEDGEPR